MLTTIKKQKNKAQILRYTVVLILFGIIYFNMCIHINAEEQDTDIEVSKYEFSEKSDYEISKDALSNDTSTLGKLSITGNFEKKDDKDGIPSFDVQADNLEIKYDFDSSILDADEKDWHLKDDSGKTVDSIELEKKIKSGVIIIQTSFDGKTWATASIETDVFSSDKKWKDSIYKTNDIQLENGCYYRIIIAYKLQRKIGEKKVLIVTKDKTEEKKVAEVYQFYAVNSESSQSAVSVSDKPQEQLGKMIEIKEGKGYKLSEKIEIGDDDPHLGWNIGTFVINGYTSEVYDNNGTPVFLKNSGDKVTLWFKLLQDINCLNDNENLSVAEDKKGSDPDAGVSKINFKHGTLIITYTDFEGKKDGPNIYTDFLKANAINGTDTKVQLFEEGDYEVVLDYKIKKENKIWLQD